MTKKELKYQIALGTFDVYKLSYKELAQIRSLTSQGPVRHIVNKEYYMRRIRTTHYMDRAYHNR